VSFPLATGFAMDRMGKGVPYVVAGVLVLLTLILTASMERFLEPVAVATPPG
jgi:hypothetical protein